MNVRYRVELSQAERDELTTMLGGGKHAARKVKRAQILLATDAGSCDAEIVRTVRVSLSTVSRTKRRFVEGNLERALSEEPRPGAERKLTGKEEALLVATACAKPPAGRKRWTLTLLADAMVKFTDHDSLSGETVRRRLAKIDLKPWRRDMWCIPRAFAGWDLHSLESAAFARRTPYNVHSCFCLLVGGRDESSDQSKIEARASPRSRAITLAFIHTYVHMSTSARRSRHPAPLRVSPPSVHQMIVTLDGSLHPTSAHRPEHRSPRLAGKLPPSNSSVSKHKK